MSETTRAGAAYPAAELDRRFYAYAVDRLLVWGAYAIAVGVAVRYLFGEGRTPLGILLIVGTVLLVSLAFAVLVGLRGITPGKAIVGLRVVDHHSGAPIGVPAALLRGLILGVAALPTVGLGVATLAWTAVMDAGGWRRGWHDHRSGAVVVDVRPVPVVEEAAAGRPRQMVNLTAMRLMSPAQVAAATASGAAPLAPAPPPRPVPPTTPTSPAPTTPPPATPPPSRPPPPPVPPTSPAAREAADEAGSTRRREPVAATPASQGVTWRVIFDTGETFVVEGLALVGRRPEPRAGETMRHAVPLRSADMSISKTHAQFQVTPDGALVVMDRGSTNGSVIVRQGVPKPLTAGRPATLLDGDVVRFGDRTMTVERS